MCILGAERLGRSNISAIASSINQISSGSYPSTTVMLNQFGHYEAKQQFGQPDFHRLCLLMLLKYYKEKVTYATCKEAYKRGFLVYHDDKKEGQVQCAQRCWP
ncbi:hypothetical protein ACJX0J_021796, partial [Zea mays]